MLFIVFFLEIFFVVFMEVEELGVEFCICDDISLCGLFEYLLVYFVCLFCSVVLIFLSLYFNCVVVWNIEGVLRMMIIDECDIIDDFCFLNIVRKYFIIDILIWGFFIFDFIFFLFLFWLSY